jgi:hypothetical protein
MTIQRAANRPFGQPKQTNWLQEIEMIISTNQAQKTENHITSHVHSNTQGKFNNTLPLAAFFDVGNSLFKFDMTLGERQESSTELQLNSDTYQIFERHLVVEAADANTCERTRRFVCHG